MTAKALWGSSAQKIIALPGTGGRLASPRLLSAETRARIGPDDIVRGSKLAALIKLGQQKALREHRLVLLRVTGRPGRPEERVVLPPNRAPKSRRRIAFRTLPGTEGAAMDLFTKLFATSWSSSITASTGLSFAAI